MDHRRAVTKLDSPLLGRAHDLARLDALVRSGTTAVLYGPVGVGKSALLRAMASHARQRGVPCGLVARTSALSHFTEALTFAYPGVPTTGGQRQLRARLRIAVEARPGLLLLDGLGRTGTAFKGALRAVRGMGLGVVLAADVDRPRDHERLRALGLSRCEIELRPLHGRSIRALLETLLAERPLAGNVDPDSLRALVAAAEGLPGRAVEFADALVDPTAWSAGRPRVDWLRTGSVIGAAERYRQSLDAI
jgi:replication-associated recombination protein RarA